MTYKTRKAIRDTQDNDFHYYAGAIYPRSGLEVSEERLAELIEKGAIEPNGVGEATEKPLTTKELKAKLDELGIKYASNAKKDELQALLGEVGGE